MKTLTTILTLIISVASFGQTIFKSDQGTISFFSEAPLENISAVNDKVKSLIKTSTSDVAFVVPIRSFDFEKDLMEEHFNENYMESDRFKVAKFVGKIETPVDFRTPGTYEVQVKGTLDIHGVEQERTFDGTLTVSQDQLKVDSKFLVRLEDHKIKIPKVVVSNIAEEVEVTVAISYSPKTEDK